jgi:hypothetical protein
MKVKPDNAAALEFLERWAPGGPWVLTAIQVDRKAIATRTFLGKDRPALERWLTEYNGVRNVYFHVNPTIREVSKKAEREDIKELAWLHVDIDPRAGEGIEEEQERALSLLTDRLPEGVPAPTVVLFSGGGYQGFWRLSNPIPVNGDLGLAEDAKRYNQQLEILFGADNCHNIDRIMRLPGTVNLPDAKKLKKGRVPTLATLVHFSDVSYPTSAFVAAPSVQMPEELGFSSGGTVTVSGNVERISDVGELDQWSVPDRVKVIIVQGRHPDETKAGDNSRSAWLFDCICQLVRCEVPDDIIFSILTDPDFGISESVLDKGTNAEKYAIRQIERGKEEAVNPWLRKLNELHAVIGNMGGKCRVVEEVMDQALHRTRLTRQSFDDFRNRYMNKTVEVGRTPNGLPITKPLGKFWLEHPARRQFETIVFAPGKEVQGAYNMWKGFACQSRPGDCSLYLTHLRDNVCNGDEAIYAYLIRWMARAVQEPDTPGEVAVVLRGGRGTGKSFFAKEFGKLFGRHFLQVSNSSHLVGNFNSHLRDVVVLFADEAFYAGDKKHSSILKTLITEETITIEAKGVDAEAAPNYVHLIMASNDRHVIPAGGDERRFLVLDVGHEQQQRADYFGKIMAQMSNGGREALLHHLRTLDLDGFQVRDVPKTEALRDQKLLSLDTEEEWWYQKLLEGRTLRNGDSWETEVRKDALVDDFIHYTQRFNVTRRGSATALGKFLSRVCPGLNQTQRMAIWEEVVGDGYSRRVEKRTYFWELPTLEKARERWELLYGPEKWDEVQLALTADRETVPF